MIWGTFARPVDRAAALGISSEPRASDNYHDPSRNYIPLTASDIRNERKRAYQFPPGSKEQRRILAKMEGEERRKKALEDLDNLRFGRSR